MKGDIDRLVEQRLIEAAPIDPRRADVLIAEAKRHLASAAAIAASDHEGAYALLYDAARKAVTARMTRDGYRVKADRPGAHRAVVLYAEATWPSDDHVVNFDRMRRQRNRSEYGPRSFSEAEVMADLEHARGIVALVAEP